MGQSADKNSTQEILLEQDLKAMFCFAWIIFLWELPRGVYLKKVLFSSGGGAIQRRRELFQ